MLDFLAAYRQVERHGIDGFERMAGAELDYRFVLAVEAYERELMRLESLERGAKA